MNKAKSFLYRASCAIMIFFFACIFLQTTVNLSHMELLEGLLGNFRKFIFVPCGAALLLLIFLKLTKLLCRQDAKRRNIIFGILACTGIALQLFLILGLRPCLQYDSLKPVDTAIAMTKGVPLAATEYYGYFSIYPHNLPLTLYIMLIFKAAGALGIASENYIVLLQLLNCLLFDAALVSMYRFLKRHFGIQKSVAFALLCFFNPLTFYYPVFFYTQVLSIPLFVFLITVFDRLLEAETTRSRILYGALYGMIVFFAWKIRFFTLITLIACALFLFFRKRTKRMELKSVFAVLSAVLLTFAGCNFLHEELMTKYTVHTEESQAFPMQHWVMMGLQGDGTFYYADEDFTAALPYKDIRIEENTKVIKERLSDLGVDGLLKLWGRKMNVTWSDGYDDYAANLTLVRHYTALDDFLSGWRSEPIAAYLHFYNCMIWLLLLLCAIALFQKGASDPVYTVCITVLGGILFHLVWEAGEPYSMPFALLTAAGAAIGTDIFYRPKFEEMAEKTHKAVRISAVSVCLAVVLFVPKAWTAVFPVTETAAIQNLVGGSYLYLENGDTITQTIQSSRTFNKLTLRYKYYEETEGEALATLRLYNEAGECLTEQTMPLKSAVTVTEFPLDDIAPDGKETYTVTLTGETVPEGSRIGVTAYNTGNWDAYPEGEASLNGETVRKADLYFELTNECSRRLF